MDLLTIIIFDRWVTMADSGDENMVRFWSPSYGPLSGPLVLGARKQLLGGHSKFHCTDIQIHITAVLKSLHWLKIPERINFKVLSLTHNSLQSSQAPSPHTFVNSSPSSQHDLLDHHPLSPFLDPRSLLISCFPPEPYQSLSHVFGMTYHLNSAPFLRLHHRHCNHKTSSSSASSIRHPQGRSEERRVGKE